MANMGRRDFLRSAATASAGAGLWSVSRLSWAGGQAPNQRLAIACIGVGGKGGSDTDHAGLHGDVVAICDIDEKRLDAKAAKFPMARKYTDFRKLLDEMSKSIDAVTVSTPDHTHAPASLMAMRMGKHVYCQKPLTHSVYEARLMRDTARQHKVVTQMGNQGTADDGFRRGVEIVRSGAIGPVREVHVWTNRPFKYWKQAPDIVARPKEITAVPAHVHWDLFLGPAAERAYNPVYHPHDWRGWWAFGTGSLGDMACHTANLAFQALKLGLPTRISAQSGEINPETYPAWAIITYEFPARGDLPPVKLTWYEGARDGKRNLPELEQLKGRRFSDSGSLIVGAKGAMYSPSDYGSEQVLLPEKDFKDYQAPSPTLPRLGGGSRKTDENHKGEWIRAIKGEGPAPMSNFDYASTITESMLLGNVAVRIGKAIEYDPETQKVANSSEAEQYIKPEFRAGWGL